MADTTIYFYGHRGIYGFLSNFYRCSFVHQGITYTSSEQAMMHRKALYFNDKSTAENIMLVSDPKAIKALGRSVQHFNDLDWKQRRVDIVEAILVDKFLQNPDLRERLWATHPHPLAEASPTDKIWGIGLREEDAKRGASWRGLNLLGKTLTKVRDTYCEPMVLPEELIELVEQHANTTRNRAIGALYKNDGDVVNAVIELGN